MSHQSVAPLFRTLRGHVGLGKSRLETLCMLVVGMVGARTVNLTHIASAGANGVQIASTYRRLQRFFQHVDLGPDWTAAIIARLIGRSGDWTLALDRTNWKIGARDVNYLVLAVVTRRFRVPLFCTLLDGRGNSGTATRIALMERYLAHFPASSVRILLADREFIGAEWLEYLNDSNIRFAIRLREDLRVTCEEGFELTLLARLRRRRARFFRARIGTREDAAASDATRLHFAARRLKGERLIVVSNIPGPKALAAYRKRRAIESLFGDAKTRLARTSSAPALRPSQAPPPHGLLALAIVWAGRAAADLIGRGAPKRKPHGYLAQSWFRAGFDKIRNLLALEPEAALAVWRTRGGSASIAGRWRRGWSIRFRPGIGRRRRGAGRSLTRIRPASTRSFAPIPLRRRSGAARSSGFPSGCATASHCRAIDGSGWLSLPASRCATAGTSKGPRAREPSMGEIAAIGVDLAKSVFRLRGVTADERVASRRRLRSWQASSSSAGCRPAWSARRHARSSGQPSPRTVVRSASSHFRARALAKLGHDVRLMPPSHVKPRVKRGKTEGERDRGCGAAA